MLIHKMISRIGLEVIELFNIYFFFLLLLILLHLLFLLLLFSLLLLFCSSCKPNSSTIWHFHTPIPECCTIIHNITALHYTLSSLFCFYDLYIPSLFPIDLFPSFRPFSDLTVFFLLSFSIDTQVYRQTLTHTYIQTHKQHTQHVYI